MGENSQILQRSFRYLSCCLLLFMMLGKCWSRPSERHVIAKENVHPLHICRTEKSYYHKSSLCCAKPPGLTRINNQTSVLTSTIEDSGKYWKSRDLKSNSYKSKQCWKAQVIFTAQMIFRRLLSKNQAAVTAKWPVPKTSTHSISTTLMEFILLFRMGVRRCRKVTNSSFTTQFLDTKHWLDKAKISPKKENFPTQILKAAAICAVDVFRSVPWRWGWLRSDFLNSSLAF